MPAPTVTITRCSPPTIMHFVEGTGPGAHRASAGWSKAVHAVTAGHHAPMAAVRDVPMGRRPASGGVEGRDGIIIGHLITLGGLTLPNLEPTSNSAVRCRQSCCGNYRPRRFRSGSGCDCESNLSRRPTACLWRGVGAPTSTAGASAGVGGEVTLTLVDGQKIRRRNRRRAPRPRDHAPSHRAAAATATPGRAIRRACCATCVTAW